MKKLILWIIAALLLISPSLAGETYAAKRTAPSVSHLFGDDYFYFKDAGFFAVNDSHYLTVSAGGEAYALLISRESSRLEHRLTLAKKPLSAGAFAGGFFLLFEDGEISYAGADGTLTPFPFPQGFKNGESDEITAIFTTAESVVAVRKLSVGGNTFYDAAELAPDFSEKSFTAFTAKQNFNAKDANFTYSEGYIYFVRDGKTVMRTDFSDPESAAETVYSSAGIKSIAVDGGTLYLLTGTALTVCSLSSLPAAAASSLAFTGGESFKSGTICSGLFVYARGGQLFVLDFGAAALCRFTYEEGALTPSGALYSKSSQRLLAPADIASNGLVLDRKLGILKGKTGAPIETGLTAPVLAAADSSGNTYVSDGTSLKVFSGEEAPGAELTQGFGTIVDLSASCGEGVLVLTADTLFLLNPPSAPVTVSEGLSGALSVCANPKTGSIFVLTLGGISVIEQSGGVFSPAGTIELEPGASGAFEIETDFGGNLYLLTETRIFRRGFSAESWQDFDITAGLLSFGIDSAAATAFAIEKSTGDVLVAFESCAFAARYRKTDMLTVSESDPLPVEIEPENSYGGTLVENLRFAKILRYPSNMLYEAQGGAPSEIAGGTVVTVLEETGGEYYYVLCNGKTGFVFKYGAELVSAEALSKEHPENASPLFDSTPVFSIPSLDGGNTLKFEHARYNKSDRLTVTALLTLGDTDWYLTDIGGKTAFVPAYALGVSVDTAPKVYEYLKISAGNAGATLYSGEQGEDSIGVLSDGIRVKVLDKSGARIKIEADIDGKTLTGFIEKASAVPDGLTNEQKTGLLMLGSLVLLGLVTLIVRKFFFK